MLLLRPATSPIIATGAQTQLTVQGPGLTPCEICNELPPLLAQYTKTH